LDGTRALHYRQAQKELSALLEGISLEKQQDYIKTVTNQALAVAG
jgi:hypothetical protein